jgi:ribosome maturation factor RimP
MRYAAKEPESAEIASVRGNLEKVLFGLGFDLIEFTVSRHKGGVQIRVVIYRRDADISVDDCSKAHRSITPQLELAFPGRDIRLEVSSPGIERLIKDGTELKHYKGRGVRCYRTDISGWTAGILESAGEQGVVLKTKDESVRLNFDIIAKAKLVSLQEV